MPTSTPTRPPASGAPAPKNGRLRPGKGRTERPANLALDRRSWEYRLLAQTRADLATLIGPSPSVMQKALADRAAWLTVHVAVMDSTFSAGRKMGDNDAREYASLSNLLVRTLDRLGKDPGKGNVPGKPAGTLKAIIASHTGRADAGP